MEKLIKFNRIVEKVCAKYPNIKVVDGVRLDSNKEEYIPDGKEHIVEVYM